MFTNLTKENILNFITIMAIYKNVIHYIIYFLLVFVITAEYLKYKLHLLFLNFNTTIIYIFIQKVLIWGHDIYIFFKLI